MVCPNTARSQDEKMKATKKKKEKDKKTHWFFFFCSSSMESESLMPILPAHRSWGDKLLTGVYEHHFVVIRFHLNFNFLKKSHGSQASATEDKLVSQSFLFFPPLQCLCTRIIWESFAQHRITKSYIKKKSGALFSGPAKRASFFFLIQGYK